MLDKSFQKELDKLHSANKKYKNQLSKVEAEIENKFGVPASNNDSFIDHYHTGCANMTVWQLNESMKIYSNIAELF